MIKDSDIEKLAGLSRLEITKEEASKLASEIEAILLYVSQVEEASGGERKLEVGAVHNIMRDDGVPHESGQYTKKLLEQSPDTEKGYLKVKKIL